MKQPRFMNLLAALLLPLIVIHFVVIHADLESDREALLSLRATLLGRTRSWNLSTTPCSWEGVVCGGANVIELHLPGMGLRGQLPLGSVGNLTHLQILSLRFNSIQGPIPPDIVNLASIQTLQLEGNSFSGNIPDFLFSMQSLTNLSLASNKFTGQISPSFNNLTKLVALGLEKNNLTGSIPDLNLHLDQFNVSYNQLSGEIPAKFSGMPESAFEGNSLCGKPLKPCNGTDGSDTYKGKGLKPGAVAGIVIGSIFGVILIIILLLICYCRKRINSWPLGMRVEAQSPREKSVGDATSTASSTIGARKLVFFGKQGRGFDLEDLLTAPAEVLGKGTYGTTYKVELEMGLVVVVKRLKDVKVPASVFDGRMKELGSVDHENLVPLRAYYYGRDEKLLVHDHIESGSLSAILHGGDGRTALSWDIRCRIALGAARGIAHLHARGPEASHGNIKSSNILLTESFEARVSDFGLPLLAAPSTGPSRFQGYRAPEVTDVQKVSQKADAYSYGVFLMELLTGNDPNSSRWNEEGGGKGLPRWVQSVVRQEWFADVFDPELLRYQNVEDAMVRLLKLAIDCTDQDPGKRPSMAEVTDKIKNICNSR